MDLSQLAVSMKQSLQDFLTSILDDAVAEEIITREQRDAILRRQEMDT